VNSGWKLSPPSDMKDSLCVLFPKRFPRLAIFFLKALISPLLPPFTIRFLKVFFSLRGSLLLMRGPGMCPPLHRWASSASFRFYSLCQTMTAFPVVGRVCPVCYQFSLSGPSFTTPIFHFDSTLLLIRQHVVFPLSFGDVIDGATPLVVRGLVFTPLVPFLGAL